MSNSLIKLVNGECTELYGVVLNPISPRVKHNYASIAGVFSVL